MLNRLFHYQEQGSSVGRECLAALTTFCTMAYILIVAPSILSKGGVPIEGAFVGTCIIAALGSFIMGLIANYPIALAPGLGLLSYFAFVLTKQGYTWQEGLGIVCVSGIIFFVITLSKIRQYILEAIPESMGYATAGGIGFFIAFIALKNIAFIVPDPNTLVTMGNLHDKPRILFIIGFLIIGALSHRGVVGALIIGMFTVTILGWLWGVNTLPTHLFALPNHAFSVIGAAQFSSLFHLSVWPALFTFFMVALFDSTGSFIALTMHLPHKSKEEQTARLNKGLLAESITTTIAGFFGVSTVSPFIENAAGIKAGGRTGLTAWVVGLIFLLAMFFSPLAASIPDFATAAALFYVGCLMAKPVAKIHWDDMLEAVPAVITLFAIPLTFSIVNGVGLGVIAYVILMLFAGKIKKIHPMLGVLAALFVLYFAI